MYSLYFEDFDMDETYYENNIINKNKLCDSFNTFSTACFILFMSYGWYLYAYYSLKKEEDYLKEEMEDDDDESVFDNYIEMIKIRRFFSDSENKNKLFNIFKNESIIISIHRILTDYNEKMFIETKKYNDYYKLDKKEPSSYTALNIKQLYEEEQIIYMDTELFDIKNNKGYYKIYDSENEKDIYTNFAKLNVYRWIIELGIYDILYDSLC